MTGREHWNRIYRTKVPAELSWYQPEARVSLRLIRQVAPESWTPILDAGGGASTLVDGLLDHDYRAVTVLDLAPAALERAQQRLGQRARLVTWLAADILTADLMPAGYGVWHDRAVFHFLQDPEDRARYVAQVRRAVRPGGHVIMASFAPDGPARCSGLDVVRYSAEAIHGELGAGFRLVESVREDHRTPAGVTQVFSYCVCRKEGGDQGLA
jgi:SAM-dependent methyltransferase